MFLVNEQQQDEGQRRENSFPYSWGEINSRRDCHVIVTTIYFRQVFFII